MVVLYESQLHNNLRNRLPVGGGCVYVLQFADVFLCFFLFFFTQPPPILRNRLPVGGGCVYVLQIFLHFVCFFSVRQKYETTVLGNG